MTDLNNDGKKDLIIGEDFGHVYYCENVGTNAAPVFDNSVMLEANGQPISFPSGYTDLKVWADDWNEDGTKDLVVGNYDDSVHLYIAYPIGVEEREGLKKNFAAYARPNPTAMNTIIHYQLPSDGVVYLSVYDTQGRIVKNLVSEYRSKGAYSTVWDCLDKHNNPIASGVYFYKLSTSESSYIDKLIVLR
jgi:hypothetical protein